MSQLVSKISKLSIPARIQLVQAILNTIAKDLEKEQEYVLSAEQSKTIQNRSEFLANGEVHSISWDSIKSKLVRRS